MIDYIIQFNWQFFQMLFYALLVIQQRISLHLLPSKTTRQLNYGEATREELSCLYRYIKFYTADICSTYSRLSTVANYVDANIWITVMDYNITWLEHIYLSVCEPIYLKILLLEVRDSKIYLKQKLTSWWILLNGDNCAVCYML